MNVELIPKPERRHLTFNIQHLTFNIDPLSRAPTLTDSDVTLRLHLPAPARAHRPGATRARTLADDGRDAAEWRAASHRARVLRRFSAATERRRRARAQRHAGDSGPSLRPAEGRDVAIH